MTIAAPPIMPDLAAEPDHRPPGAGPFAAAALALRRAGLGVIPCGGADGKTPLVRSWTRWHRPPGKAFLARLIPRHPAANIAALPGLSGLTVIDVDDPAQVDIAVARFGATPLRVWTPSGGAHLYYRSSGEPCADLRPRGLVGDLKGRGGLIIVPPSCDPRTGKTYELVAGSWADLARLPPLRPGSLDPGAVNPGPAEPVPLRAVGKGRRNTLLFRLLLREAPYCDTEADLLDVARHLNDDFAPPLPDPEVIKTARSAWGYEARGENWAARRGRVILSAAELDALTGDADAFLLLAQLRRAHGGRGEPFAVASKALARAQVIPGWGHCRYRKARDTLVGRGLLRRVHVGGRGARDPDRFVFGTLTEGSRIQTQCN